MEWVERIAMAAASEESAAALLLVLELGRHLGIFVSAVKIK